MNISFFFFSSRRRHTRYIGDWSSDVCSSDLLLHEAMDAGAGGWSVQRLKPESGANVQRDFDGSPMATDVMHTETCVEFAEVLAERRAGFIQMTMAGNPAIPDESRRCFETLARVSGRPILYN